MSSSIILFQFDLLSNVEEGLQYPEEPHLGVFTAQSRPARAVNEEDEEYVTWAATQDHQTGAVSIRAQKHSNGNITSARLESQGVSYTSTRFTFEISCTRLGPLHRQKTPGCEDMWR